MVAATARLPSALRVALRRAAHQVFDRPLVLEDPVVLQLLGAEYGDLVQRTPVKRERVWSRGARAFAVARSRVAEDEAVRGHARGVRQYCLLGAGLDTFGWRNPFEDLRVWEVDLPAMQVWKAEIAQRAGLAFPGKRVTTVPWNLEDAGLGGALEKAGLGREPTVFACLGVAPYLSRDAFHGVLACVVEHGPGSVLVMDYRLPKEALSPEEQRQHDSLQERVKGAGEPFRQFWTEDEMFEELKGFARIEDLGASELNDRFFRGREDGFAVCGEAIRMVCARV